MSMTTNQTVRFLRFHLTSGENHKIGLSPSESATDKIESIRKDDGIWVHDTYIPFHSISWFQVESSSGYSIGGREVPR